MHRIVSNSSREPAFWASMGILVIGFGVFGGGCGKAPAKTARALPIRPVDPDLRHVVMISIDTLRADHLGCYGHAYVQTPTLDAVAEEGWRFERCVATAPTTLASHTALMTGSYPHTHGTPRNGFLVNDENVMFAEIAKRYGFTTAGFIGSYALSSQFNFHQGFDHFDENFDIRRSTTSSVSAERRAEQVTDAVIQWLGPKDEEHLFLFVHYFDVHLRYDPPAPYDEMYLDKTGVFKARQNALKLRPLRKKIRAAPPANRFGPEVKAMNGFYCGEISYTDNQIDRLLKYLEERDILDHALLIITSDHGESMVEHPLDSFFNHGIETYDTTIRVPLIIRFPGGKDGGRVIDRVVSSIDVLPTILDWFGMEHPARLEGVSFAGLKAGETLAPRGAVFAEATMPTDSPFEDESVWYNARKTKCIVQDHWKLVHRPLPKQWELYDLNADPGEQENLLGTDPEPHAALIDELKARLIAWSKDADPLASAKEESEKTKSNLKSLGYAH